VEHLGRREPNPPFVASGLAVRQRRLLKLVLIVATAALAALVAIGVAVERSSRTPLIQVGQSAPDWTLPAAGGGVEALSAQRGHAVVLAFVPAVNCTICRVQLRAIQEALPDLRARGATVFAISTDLPAVQRRLANDLGLDYPILSEAPAAGLHPVGSAYGVYHQASGPTGPVDINAIVVIDAAGIVRAVAAQPSHALSAVQILALVDAGLQPK